MAGIESVLGCLCVIVLFLGCSGYMLVKENDTVTLPPSAYIPFVYPRYMQCDPVWGNDSMNGSMYFSKF
jgi:hypothetical protein